MNPYKAAGVLRVLIACECSGKIREAFRALGHDAVSCDLQEADDGSPHHIQGDALETIRSGQWDLVGMHPPCTFLSVSGIHWNDRGRGWEDTDAALKFVRDLMEAATQATAATGGGWYLENPISIISSRIRKPDQILQPFDYGDDASKRTCLWLHHLPRLVAEPKMRVPGRKVEWPRGSGKTVERWSNQTDSGQNVLAPSAGRAKARSETYPGIATTMARQWSAELAERML